MKAGTTDPGAVGALLAVGGQSSREPCGGGAGLGIGGGGGGGGCARGGGGSDCS